ncbi:unnamed protein product [Rotaria sp. Silwood1]|nr:unnamed protein product [Rotaria sp. Silwood1]
MGYSATTESTSPLTTTTADSTTMTTTTTDSTTIPDSTTTTTAGTTTTADSTTTTESIITTTATTTTADSTTTTTDSTTTTMAGTTTTNDSTTTIGSSTTTTTDSATTTDNSAITTTVNILAETQQSITNLFTDPSNPTRLTEPSGGASIDEAVETADGLLSDLRITGQYPNEVQKLTQLLGLAKGLQMLRPYFTDLTMNNVSISDQTAKDFQNTNLSINTLGVTDPGYKKTLDDLISKVAKAIKSRVSVLNSIIFSIVSSKLFKTLNFDIN